MDVEVVEGGRRGDGADRTRPLYHEVFNCGDVTVGITHSCLFRGSGNVVAISVCDGARVLTCSISKQRWKHEKSPLLPRVFHD